MAVEAFDAVVVGTGQAGPALAKKLAGAGRRVCVIERGSFGGTCVNTGCTPTKTLVASARVAHMVRRAREYGIVLEGGARLDMRRVKARRDERVEYSTHHVEDSLRRTENVTVVEGHARFVGPRRLAVGDRTIAGERVFLDVGARPRVPKLDGLDDDFPYLTEATLQALDQVPKHLLVLGGSYLGLEFAQIYRRFGAEVTVVEAGPQLLPKEDRDVAEGVRGVLEAEGITIVTGAAPRRVENIGNRVVLSGAEAGPAEIAGTHLLVATGRQPNTDDLDAAAGGVELDEKGFVKTDETLRTSAEGVWALGDCNGRGAFTHTAYDDHEIVAANLLEGADRKVSDRIMCYAMFTDPPLARCGASENALREAGTAYLVGRMEMSSVARARERDETQGFMKVLVDAHSQRILGAALLGIEADETIHLLIDTMYAGKRYTTVRDAMHIHPTVSELIPTLLKSLKPAE